ncbi:helix-turn-helix domain-containing protein [Niabella aquatica]
MNNKIQQIKTIGEFHALQNLPQPEHPLISIVDYSKMNDNVAYKLSGVIADYYSIAIKRGVGKMYYGQQQYDFDGGVMAFLAPRQVLRFSPAEENTERSGWILLIHPDFFWGTPLAKTIKNYEFFHYTVREALFLSDKEETKINAIIENIRQEYHSNIDQFSQNIIISQIETLLNYSERFYQRQFITRKISNHQILDRLEQLLDDYFNSDKIVAQGIPTVNYVAEALNISPSYLSGLLKVLTAESTQQHIHKKLIEKAKEKLSTTHSSISEIAYELGFEHPQSFSKLFKTKTKLSPLEFRQSFN